MSSSPVPDCIDALVAALASDEALADVTIRSGPFDAGKCTRVIQFGEITFNDDQDTWGPANRGLDFTVQGFIEVVEHGGGETVIAAARAGAFALMDEVETLLIAGLTVTGVHLLDAEITRGRFVPLLEDNGHRGHLEFSVRLVADLG